MDNKNVCVIIHCILFYAIFQVGDFLKKTISVFLVLVVLLSCFIVPSSAAFNSLIDVKADIVLLVNTDSDTVILDKNADKKTNPSTLAQIVTCIVALENCSDLSVKYTCKREHIAFLNEQKATNVGILAGEEMSVKDLLYCLMLHNATDAANVLAYNVGGSSIDNFVKMMNDFVKGLGCENTYFINAHGLDDDRTGYTTARDLYTIMSYAMKNETFKEIVGTMKYNVPATNKYTSVRYLHNNNRMLGRDYDDYYCSAVTGGKTGYTDKAGRCVVSTASKNGYSYMLIVMGAEQYDIDNDGAPENIALTESRRVYNWVFDKIVLQKVTSTTDVVTVVDLKYNSDVDHVRLVPAQEISTLIPKGTETGSLKIVPIPEQTPKVLEAPVKKGMVVGKANIYYGDTIIGTVDLMVAEDINRDTFVYITAKTTEFFKNFFSTVIFKILVVLIIILVILYILLIIRKKRIIAKNKKIKMIKG